MADTPAPLPSLGLLDGLGTAPTPSPDTPAPLPSLGLLAGLGGAAPAADPPLVWPVPVPGHWQLDPGYAAAYHWHPLGVSVAQRGENTSAPVGAAEETDLALPLAAVQILATGRADEADTAFELATMGGVGAAQETDTALALAALQILAVGRADEGDTALALAAVQLAATGRADETDVGLALSALQLAAVGRADEADAALALTAGGAGAGATAAEIWGYVMANGETAETNVLALLECCTRLSKLLRNKQVTSPTTGKLTVYDDDDSTVLMEGDLFEDEAGTTPYRGQGADRRERLV